MIIDRILDSLDIDARQWKAIVGVSWHSLQRRRSPMYAHARSALKGLWLGLVMYCAMGIMFAVVAMAAPSAATAAFFLLNFVMVFVASVVLLESGSSIVSPEDLLILGPRPVSSRTYFAARMAVVVVLVLVYDGALGLPAAVTLTARFGIIVGLAWILAMVLAGLSVGLFMVMIYTTALRYGKSGRVKNVMGYVQLLLSFAIYGGYGMLSQKMRDYLSTLSLAQWTVLLPSRWFASIVQLGSGDWSSFALAGSLLSVLVVIGLVRLVSGQVSMTYLDDVTEAATPVRTALPTARRRIGLSIFWRGDDRAIAMLVFRQFRNDLKFRMAVLAIVPLTILYLYQGLTSGGAFADPFLAEPSDREYASSMLVYIAMILFPAILKDEILRNDMYEAAWVFFAAPVHRGDLILSVRRILMTCFILPYLFFVSLIFLWFYGSVLHVLMHLLVLALCCDIYLVVLSQVRPALPFSLPRSVGERSFNMMAVLVLGSIFFLGILGIFMKLLYRTPGLYLGGVALLVVTSLLLRRMFRERTWKAGERLEFLA